MPKNIALVTGNGPILNNFWAASGSISKPKADKANILKNPTRGQANGWQRSFTGRLDFPTNHLLISLAVLTLVAKSQLTGQC